MSSKSTENFWNRLRVSKTVYSFIYPETKALLGRLWRQQPFHLYEDAYTKKQDRMHLPFQKTWVRWVKPIVKFKPTDFAHFYPCAGSTEAIRESLAAYAAQCVQLGGIKPRLHVFAGEYEGYAAYAKAYGIEIHVHPRSTTLPEVAFGVHDRFYLSQPSAIDGNVWTEFPQFIQWMKQHHPQVKIAVDLCYVGAVAKKFQVDLTSPNIHWIFFSLSKLFGVYYHRIGGCWSRSELPGLFGNKWFKNLFSLYLGTQLMTKFGVYDLPRKYVSYQKLALEHLRKKTKLNWQASDAIMLVNCTDGEPTSFLNRLPQGAVSQRACITPYIDHRLQRENQT